MQHSLVSDMVVSRQAQGKPCLNSYDSGQECSLAHWLEVCRLIEVVETEDRELKGYVFDESCLLVSE
jgi:hypothetical protein